MEKGLPSGYFTEFGGQYEQMQEAFLIMAGAFALILEVLQQCRQLATVAWESHADYAVVDLHTGGYGGTRRG